jgi:hypothetical protein
MDGLDCCRADGSEDGLGTFIGGDSARWSMAWMGLLGSVNRSSLAIQLDGLVVRWHGWVCIGR